VATDHIFSNRIEVRTTDSWLHRVDEWRRKQPDLPRRAEAIRRMVELGLNVRGNKS